MLRKIAVAAASKPAVEIKQEGDTFYIRTSTSVRTTEINFKVGDEFEEQTVDGRPCKVGAAKESLGAWRPSPSLSECHCPVSSWIPPSIADGESPSVAVAGRKGAPPLPLSPRRPCSGPRSPGPPPLAEPGEMGEREQNGLRAEAFEGGGPQDLLGQRADQRWGADPGKPRLPSAKRGPIAFRESLGHSRCRGSRKVTVGLLTSCWARWGRTELALSHAAPSCKGQRCPFCVEQWTCMERPQQGAFLAGEEAVAWTPGALLQPSLLLCLGILEPGPACWS